MDVAQQAKHKSLYCKVFTTNTSYSETNWKVSKTKRRSIYAVAQPVKKKPRRKFRF